MDQSESAVLEQPDLAVEEPSLRSVIEGEFDKVQEAESSAPPVNTPAAPATAPVVPPVAAPGQDGKAPVAAPGQVAPPQELKAPSQWKPQVREKWNQLPREVQEEVLRREADNLRLIGSVGHKIRVADEMAVYLQPFAQKLQESQTPVPEFLNDVFGTIRGLAHGAPIDKATIVANIIQSYGIDVGMLDKVLEHRFNEPPEVGQARAQTARAQMVINQHQNHVQGQVAGRAEQDVQNFAADPKHEFVADVRFLMADLLETGQAKSLEEAHNLACWAHPDTRAILLQREAQARATSKRQVAVAAKNASQSVSGAPRMGQPPAGALTADPSRSLRDDIAAAIDAAEEA